MAIFCLIEAAEQVGLERILILIFSTLDILGDLLKSGRDIVGFIPSASAYKGRRHWAKCTPVSLMPSD